MKYFPYPSYLHRRIWNNSVPEKKNRNKILEEKHTSETKQFEFI